MRYYIATSLKNTEDYWRLDKVLAELPDWDNTCRWPELPEELSRTNILNLELRGVRTADLVVVLFPAGRGTHVEIGYALGRGVPVLALGGAGEEILAFDHPLVMHNRMFSWPTVEDAPRMMEEAVAWANTPTVSRTKC